MENSLRQRIVRTCICVWNVQTFFVVPRNNVQVRLPNGAIGEMHLTHTAVGEEGFSDAYVMRMFVKRGASRPFGHSARLETQVRDHFLRTIAHRLTMRAAWRRWRRTWLRSARRKEASGGSLRSQTRGRARAAHAHPRSCGALVKKDRNIAGCLRLSTSRERIAAPAPRLGARYLAT